MDCGEFYMLISTVMQCSTVGGNGGCRVGEVRAGTTSSMPDQDFKLR